MSKVISLTSERLKRESVIYAIEFTHNQDGLSFLVRDVQNDQRSATSIADDMEAASKEIRRLALSGHFD